MKAHSVRVTTLSSLQHSAIAPMQSQPTGGDLPLMLKTEPFPLSRGSLTMVAPRAGSTGSLWAAVGHTWVGQAGRVEYERLKQTFPPLPLLNITIGVQSHGCYTIV